MDLRDFGLEINAPHKVLARLHLVALVSSVLSALPVAVKNKAVKPQIKRLELKKIEL